MSVSDLVRLGLADGLSNRELAEMALERDQESRRLAKLGRLAEAREADNESAALAALLQ